MTTGAKTAAKASRNANAELVSVKRPMGRPTAYKPEYVELGRKLARFGATDQEMADFFEVGVSTLYRWRNAHDDFREAIAEAKEGADERVERSLYQQAIGYEREAVKIMLPAKSRKPLAIEYREHVAPNATAAMFWLKNRRGDRWKDVSTSQLSGPDGKPIEIEAKSEMVSEIIGVLRGLRRQGSPDE
jgi:hypothetical protein